MDISYSMDPDEQQLQREGYLAALTSREFMQALKGGMNGKVAITYFEWAGLNDQKILMPWRLIDGPESADAVLTRFRARLTAVPRAPRFPARCNSPSRYSTIPAITASAASSMCRATEPK